jgi:hypothetical protein
MKRRSVFLLILLIGMLAASVPSHADSDGYFCAAKGYLAYEQRAGITPGIVGHVIKIVRFDSRNGIRTAGSITIQDFQVHKLNCGEGRIEIAGFGSAIPGREAALTTCVIEIAEGPGAPHCSDETASLNWRTWPPPKNLGQWALQESVPLESSDAGHRYRLQLKTSKQVISDNVYKLHFKTELIQTDSEGRDSQRFLIYDARVEASDGD